MLTEANSYMIFEFIPILNTDRVANRQLDVNVNQSFIKTVADKVILKEIKIGRVVNFQYIYLTELTT